MLREINRYLNVAGCSVYFCNRNGLYAKGLKTRAPKKQSSKYIIERRKK